MPKKPKPKSHASVIDQAIINHQRDLALDGVDVRADFGDAVAEAFSTLVGLEKDLEIGGPLSAYWKYKRESLIEVLIGFIELNPNDADGVRHAQSEIKEYLNFLNWMGMTFEIGTGEKFQMEARADQDEPRDD